VYESYEVSGKISSIGAEATGLKEGTLVVGGGGDQAAGAVGNGIVQSGIISVTTGTSGVVFAFADSPAVDPICAFTPSVTPCRINGMSWA
jgi:xylulokinase